MIVRKKILTQLFYLIILFNYCFPDIIINRNTTWSQDKYLTESVIIKPSGSLSIDPGVNVYIKDTSLIFLKGTELDFIQDGVNQNLVFKNPNVENECGCGESFTFSNKPYAELK